MPGLQLTLPQAARLIGLEIVACRAVIDALVETSFLRWTAKGTVVRMDVPLRTGRPNSPVATCL